MPHLIVLPLNTKMRMKKKQHPKEEKLKVNPELEGLDIHINSLGEINSNVDIEKINNFLNKHVIDKKLRDR